MRVVIKKAWNSFSVIIFPEAQLNKNTEARHKTYMEAIGAESISLKWAVPYIECMEQLQDLKDNPETAIFHMTSDYKAIRLIADMVLAGDKINHIFSEVNIDI